MEVELTRKKAQTHYSESLLAAEPVHAIHDQFKTEWYPKVQQHLHPLRELAKFFYDDPVAAPFRRYAIRMDEAIMLMLQSIAARTQATVYFRLEYEPPDWLQRHGIIRNSQNQHIYRDPKFRALAKRVANDTAVGFKRLHEQFTLTYEKVAAEETKALMFSERFHKRRRAMDLMPPPRHRGLELFVWILLFGPPVGQEPPEMAKDISHHIKGVISVRMKLLDLISQLERYWSTLGSLDHNQISQLSDSALDALHNNRMRAAQAHRDLSSYLLSLCPYFVGVETISNGISCKTDIPGWPASLYADPDLKY